MGGSTCPRAASGAAENGGNLFIVAHPGLFFVAPYEIFLRYDNNRITSVDVPILDPDSGERLATDNLEVCSTGTEFGQLVEAEKEVLIARAISNRRVVGVVSGERFIENPFAFEQFSLLNPPPDPNEHLPSRLPLAPHLRDYAKTMRPFTMPNASSTETRTFW